MDWLGELKPIFTAGQVVLAVAVLSPLIPSFDKVNVLVIILGLVGVSVCWSASLLFARKAKFE